MSNIYVIAVPEGEEKENQAEKILEEIITETFQTWWKHQTVDLWSSTSPMQDETEKTPPKHTIIKLMKHFKEKKNILKVTRKFGVPGWHSH